MAMNRMTVSGGGRVSDPDRPYINTSIELHNIPWWMTPSSGDPIMALGLEQRIETLTRNILRLEELVRNLSHQIDSLETTELEQRSESIQVPPLSQRRVNVKIQRREPASFRFIEDDEETTSSGTED